MNPILYQLHQARVAADGGNLGPVRLHLDSPAILAPAGDIVVRSAESAYRVNRGRFILLRDAGAEWTIESVEEKEFAPVYIVQFQCYRQIEKKEDRLIYQISGHSLPPHGSIMEFPRQAMNLLLQLMEETRLAVSVHSAPRLNVLLAELLHRILVVNVYAAIIPTKDPAIEQAIAYIQQNYGASLSRASMAELVGFNPSYFSSLFRKETGWGFTEYLGRVRMNEAKRLMLSTTYTLQEIAIRTGFSDGAYLAKAFRKSAGIAASEFRRGNRDSRIAAMQFVGALLALGVRPIAATRDTIRVSAQLWEDLRGMEVMEELHSMETLKPLEPELILAPTYYFNFPETLRELEKVAPVLLLEWGKMDKLEEVRTIGQLLGRTEEAEDWVRQLQQRARSARQAVSGFLKPGDTAAIYELSYTGTWLIPYLTARSAYNLYELLALIPPKRVQDEGISPAKHLFVEEEELPAYAANHMFVIVPEDDLAAARDKLMSRIIWQKFAREGRSIHLLRLSEFWMDDGVSLERQLDIMADRLTEGQWTQQFSR